MGHLCILPKNDLLNLFTMFLSKKINTSAKQSYLVKKIILGAHPKLYCCTHSFVPLQTDEHSKVEPHVKLFRA